MTDIRIADLNLLKALDALLETRSVTGAAARLSLSQPTVSGMLARLRDMFGDPLFVRTQRGILPTPRAEALAVPLKAALQELEAILQPVAFDPARAERTISIAATDYAQRVLILPFLSLLRREAPGIRVAVRSAAGENVEIQMERGGLDLALITPDVAAETLRSRHLFEEGYVCVLRQGHPAALQLDMDRFCGLDHAIMSHDGTQFSGATDQALQRVGRTRRVIAAVPNFTILLDLVKTTDCCALLPSRLVHGEPGVVTVKPPVPVAGFTKILVWHERTQADPCLQWARDRLAAMKI